MMVCVCVCNARRIPLIKGKTARQSLKEQGLWEEFRKAHPYNPTSKFIQDGSESMTNDADVSSNQKEPPSYIGSSGLTVCS